MALKNIPITNRYSTYPPKAGVNKWLKNMRVRLNRRITKQMLKQDKDFLTFDF